MIGCGTVCWPCGIIFYVGMFYRSESCMQWIRHLSNIVQWCDWMNDDEMKDLTFIYDDACHLSKVIKNPKRVNCHPVWTWLSKLKYYLDRLHRRNHKKKCQKLFSIPKSDLGYHWVNTQVCESLYKWLSAFKHIVCNQTQLHFKWFSLGLCHFRNIEIEKSLQQGKVLASKSNIVTE